MSFFGASEFFLEVAKGNVPRHRQSKPYGFNPGVVINTTEDVWSEGGTKVLATVAEVMSVVSDSALDSAAGTGLRTILIGGLDANFLNISETVTLNGVTPALTVNSYIRIQRVFGRTAGSLLVNQGTIRLTGNVSGNVQSNMLPLAGFAQGVHYTCPAAASAFVFNFAINANKATGATAAIQMAIVIQQGITDGSAFTLLEERDSSDPPTLSFPLQVPLVLNARDDFKAIAQSDKAGTEFTAYIAVIEVDDA